MIMNAQNKISATILVAFIAAINIHELAAQVCSNVYPQLSCGIKHREQGACESAGCCWNELNEAENRCFSPKIYGYQFEQTVSQPGLLKGSLSLNKESGLTFGSDFIDLDITVTQETASRTHIKIIPSQGNPRWEVPEDVLPRPGGLYTGSDAQMSTTIQPQNDDDQYDNMEILVRRTVPGTDGTVSNPAEPLLIFTKMLVFQPQYLQFVLGVPPKVEHTYGFGESTRDSQEMTANTTYTLWNSDWPAQMPDTAIYGSHPFMLQVASDGKAHGVLFMNSNAMDVTYSTSDSQGRTVGVQSTGGVLDLYVFAGPSPAEVVQQYLEVVGRPAMVPFWSLGLHNCRWGYESVAYVAEVVANYSTAGIPLETQWMDIDYMDEYKDFTLNPELFSPADMKEFIDTLHAHGQRFVPIVDPGIYAGDAQYPALKQGLEQGVFVADLTGTAPFLGKVWPGQVYFPDFFAENTAGWWQTQLEAFHQLAQYDGLWIDMNEVSNFCNEAGADQVCEYAIDENRCKCSTVDPDNTHDFAPFVPHLLVPELGGKTIAMSALHAGGVLEYDAHNLHGMMESIATRAALLKIRDNKRPFILSRSTFLGSGKYTAHWTGDNAATWNDLRWSIITMNNLALFGLSMTGADICGFNGDTTEELCARWIEVGAFSTFVRDHNAINQMSQELYRWESVTQASITALQMRYSLLPHLYTLMYRAATRGDTVHNAMWVHFPEDSATFAQEGQFMWSDSLLFTPVLEKGATQVRGYFPAGVWYSLFEPQQVVDATLGGLYVDLPTPLTATNAHVRGGTVLPMQPPAADAAGPAMTTSEVRASPYRLLVALDALGRAKGSLFEDDGEDEALQSFNEVEFSAAGGTLSSTVLTQQYSGSTGVLGTVEIRGLRLDAIDAKAGSTPECVAQLLDDASGTSLATSMSQGHGSGGAAINAHLLTLLDERRFSAVFDLSSAGATIPIASNYNFIWKCSAVH